METVTQHLKSHGIRPSVQRVAIMKYLMEHHTHPTAETIYVDLRETVPTLSRTTVYNTLQLLASCHAINILSIDKRNMNYDGRTEPHAHFLCQCCGKIVDVEVDAHLHEHLYSSEQFKVEQVELNYTGVCHECARKAQASDEN